MRFILNTSHVSLAELAKLTEIFISAKFMVGDITQIKTSFLYKCIQTRVSWDNKFNINNYNDMVNEILF